MMLKKGHNFYLKRIFFGITVSIATALALLFLLSVAISFTAFTNMNKDEIHSYANKGQQLFLDYSNGKYTADELDDILNPELKTDNQFMILIDSENHIIAQSREVAQYIREQDIPGLTQKLGRGEYYTMSLKTQSGEEIPNIIAGVTVGKDGRVIGFVLAGRILYNFDSALRQYRLNLLLLLLLVVASFIFPGYWISKRLSEPAQVLKDAANRFAGGDLNVRGTQKLKGEMREIAAAFNDMSERLSRSILELSYQKKSIELILEGLSEGIVAMDDGFFVIRENQAVSRLFKNKSSKGYLELVSSLKECVTTGRTYSGKILEGETVLQVTVTSISAENNGQVFAVALVRDITENERLEKTRHDYVANISHELRTPLSSMRGLIEGLRDGVVTRDSDRQRYYSILGSEVLRLSRLVNDLLELSGLQSSTDAFEMEAVDVTEMMYDLHDRYKKMFEEQRKQFVLNLPGEELPKVTSNEDRITQVLTIFLDNAIKYTPATGRVEIGASRKPEGVYFYVSDNGAGIDEKNLDKIFDRFYQAEVSRSDHGNGLGLSIAKEILDKLNIRVCVRSAIGEGSEFGFVVSEVQE